MKHMVLIATAAVCLATSDARADDWLFVRPGMVVAENLAAWQAACNPLILTNRRGEENYLTCSVGESDAITANVAPDGVVWWSRYWGAGHLDHAAFVAHFQQELGLAAAPRDCLDWDDPALCWDLGNVRVTITLRDIGGGWSIQMHDTTTPILE